MTSTARPASSESATILARASSGPSFTPLQEKADLLVGDFITQATDYKTLTAMVGAGMAYRFARFGTLAAASSLFPEGNALASGVARGSSYVIGLAGESATFTGINRTFDFAEGKLPTESFSKEWLNSAISLGPLKFFGKLGEDQNPLLQHFLADAGMVSSHHLASLAQLEEKPEGNLFSQLLNAEAMNWQMKAGMGLVHEMVPGLAASEKAMDLSLRSREGDFLSSIKNPLPVLSLKTAEGVGHEFSPWMLMSAEGKSGGKGQWPKEASRLKEMEARITELQDINPQDPAIAEHFSAIADLLQSKGDPRGDWIALELRRQEMLSNQGDRRGIARLEIEIAEIRNQVQADIKERFGFEGEYRFDAATGFTFRNFGADNRTMTMASFSRFFKSEYGFLMTGVILGILDGLTRWSLSSTSLGHLTGLRELTISNSEYFVKRNLPALLRAQSLSNLRSLNLRYNGLDSTHVRALAKSPILSNLQSLYLLGNPKIDAEEMKAITQSPTLSNLKVLNGRIIRRSASSSGRNNPPENDGNLHSFAAPALMSLDLMANGHPTLLGMALSALSLLPLFPPVMGVFDGLKKPRTASPNEEALQWSRENFQDSKRSISFRRISLYDFMEFLKHEPADGPQFLEGMITLLRFMRKPQMPFLNGLRHPVLNELDIQRLRLSALFAFIRLIQGKQLEPQARRTLLLEFNKVEKALSNNYLVNAPEGWPSKDPRLLTRNAQERILRRNDRADVKRMAPFHPDRRSVIDLSSPVRRLLLVAKTYLDPMASALDPDEELWKLGKLDHEGWKFRDPTLAFFLNPVSGDSPAVKYSFYAAMFFCGGISAFALTEPTTPLGWKAVIIGGLLTLWGHAAADHYWDLYRKKAHAQNLQQLPWRNYFKMMQDVSDAWRELPQAQFSPTLKKPLRIEEFLEKEEEGDEVSGWSIVEAKDTEVEGDDLKDKKF